MTQIDPAGSNRPAPKRSTKFNGLVVGLVVLLFVVAGIYVWSHWSATDDSAADEAAGGPVQPAQLPTPADDSVPVAPAQVAPGADPSGDASARGVEAGNVPPGAEAPR
ncbi:hypothetical protein GGQ87_001403 [Brevundimonas alba]|uniref:Uncharacterized protein n=1 Tax=Brevundimonas alba TaxID=74314 RepID=A0A7X5YJL1_9CAUL|nr:hypothetical protein [Brevundimonas alba]NJC41145.1 hypothetical protein [Brevundimonas alba]